MPDYSIYEKGNQTRENSSQGICFGRITRVYPETRTCEIKTFFGRGSTDDNHIPHCQWINLDAHPDGDESTVIPRINSYGLVFYIAGEPFVFGMFSPLNGTGSAQIGDVKEPLNEGDRILKTIGQNKVILRAHGEIQIESTQTCRTIYFPDFHLINTLCRNYEFRTDGGTIDWKNDGADNTLCRTEYRDTLQRANVIIEEKGLVDGSIISRIEIGIGGDDGAENITYTQFIRNTGEYDRFIRAPNASSGHHLNILPNGRTELNIADKTTCTIEPTGETNLSVNKGKAIINISPSGKITITADADVDVHTKANFKVKADADVTMEGSGGKMKLSGGKVAMGASNELLDLFDQTLTQLQKEQHPTPLGPSGPPMNAAAYGQIQSKLGQIKGGL
jgi:hypothetical protein